MPKHRTGLHKKVSAIFGDVGIAKDIDAKEPSDASAPKQPAPKPQTPSHMTPTKPKPKMPLQQEAPPTKAEPLKQPKAEPIKQTRATAVLEIIKQIPLQQTFEKIKNKLFASKPGVSNARQKKMVILVPVLFIILIVVLSRVLSTPTRGTSQFQGLEPTNTPVGSDDMVAWQIPEPYPKTLRDPMKFGSVTTAQSDTGKLIVRGIVYSEDNPTAVIGDQIVHEGDKISETIVVKINKNSVEFEINGKRWTQQVQR